MAAGEILAARDREIAELRATLEARKAEPPQTPWWRRLLGRR
jgi:hypothetical protein